MEICTGTDVACSVRCMHSATYVLFESTHRHTPAPVVPSTILRNVLWWNTHPPPHQPEVSWRSTQMSGRAWRYLWSTSQLLLNLIDLSAADPRESCVRDLCATIYAHLSSDVLPRPKDLWKQKPGNKIIPLVNLCSQSSPRRKK